MLHTRLTSGWLGLGGLCRYVCAYLKGFTGERMRNLKLTPGTSLTVTA